MSNKFPKILIIFFLIVFIFQLASLLFLLLAPSVAKADDITFTPQVTVGEDFIKGQGKQISGTSIGEYIKAIYKYAIGVVGILAAVVLMFGGVIWLMAGGNAERIGNAKSWIAAALTGLLIALCSFMILSLISPDLVNFKSINPEKVKDDSGDGATSGEPIGCCYNPGIRCYTITETECNERKSRTPSVYKDYVFTRGVCNSGSNTCDTSCKNTYPACNGSCPASTTCQKVNNSCKCVPLVAP